MNADNKGIKADESKPRLDLVPPDSLLAMGNVLGHGAAKYGDRNWERGMDWGRVIGAAHRHLLAIQMGEDYDHETGESHAAHLMCCAAFLHAYLQRRIGVDDRNKLVVTTAITPAATTGIVANFTPPVGNVPPSYDNKTSAGLIPTPAPYHDKFAADKAVDIDAGIASIIKKDKT